MENSSVLDLFGEPWPTEVTEANRNRIRVHLELGRSPEEAAALIIWEDDIIDILNEIETWVHVSPKEASLKMDRVHFGYYRHPIAIFLAVEGYRRTKKVQEANLEMLKELADDPRFSGDVTFQGFVMSQDAENQLLIERVDKIWEEEGPIKAYDAIIDYELHKISGLKNSRDIHSALEKSGQRFHQLYTVAQQESQQS